MSGHSTILQPRANGTGNDYDAKCEDCSWEVHGLPTAKAANKAREAHIAETMDKGSNTGHGLYGKRF